MKRISVAFAAGLLLLATIGVEGGSGQCGPVRYKVYGDANYGGPALFYCYNAPDLSQFSYGGFPWQNFNNMISSLKVVSDHLTVYDGTNYAGFLGTYYLNTSYVGDSYNDRFSSLSNGYNP